jgi:hypothetical protein
MGKTAAGPLLTTIAEVEAWLDQAAAIDNEAGTLDNPIPLRLGAELFYQDTALDSAIDNKAKYVALDLSAFTDDEMKTIYDFSLYTGFRTYAVTIVLPDVSWKIESIPAGSPVFNTFEVLKEVRGANITTIGNNAFDGCSNLESVSFPKATDIGDNAFQGCGTLESVSFPKAGTIGQSAFNGCTTLTTVSLPAATDIGDAAFASCNALATVTLTAVTSIGNQAFGGCTALTTLILPAAPPTLPSTALTGAFAYTNPGAGEENPLTIKVPPNKVGDYTSTTTPGWNVAADTLPGANEARYGTNHNRIFITDSGAPPPFLLTSVIAVSTYLGTAQEAGTPADPVYLPVGLVLAASGGNGWTDLLDAISTANKHVNLDLSACTRSNLASGGGLYSTGTFDPDSAYSTGKDKIVSLVLPDAATIIIAGTYSDAAFQYFTALKNVSGANIETVYDYAFYNTPIATVDFPEALTIGQYAFQACTSLTTVNLPNAATIGENAFEGFGTGPLTVTLGSAAPTLGTDMFSLVPSTKNVIVKVPSGATGYGLVPGTYNEPVPPYTVNWGNGFRGGGWTGSTFQYDGANYVNSHVKLTIEVYTP